MKAHEALLAFAAAWPLAACQAEDLSAASAAPAPLAAVAATAAPTAAPQAPLGALPLRADATAAEVSRAMVPGINLGNTLEAWNGQGPYPYTTSQESYWGNPAVTQAIFDGYAAAGFKSVRIPVAWNQYASANGTIAPFWLARVKQVVDMARAAGLVVMINAHWDGGWIDATPAAQGAANAKLTTYWTQIANTFKDYDHALIFAGTNEIQSSLQPWVAPSAGACAIQNGFNQTFVNAVRATGGNNAVRPLVFQAYNTNIDIAVTCNAVPPTDSAAKALMAEVHYYDPYNFALNDRSTIWQWGKDATQPSATETWANEPYVDRQFAKMKALYADKGIPVILGEYGAYPKPAFPGMAPFVRYWASYVTRSATWHGAVPMWWDTGALFNRATGAQKDPATIAVIVDAARGPTACRPKDLKKGKGCVPRRIK